MTDKALEAALLPCPFCGGEAVLSQSGGSSEVDGYTTFHTVTCKSCHVGKSSISKPYTGPKPDEAIRSVIAAWNRRAALSALPGEAEVVAHAEFLGGRPTAVRLEKSRHCTEPLVTLASLQAMQARAEKAERERDEASREMRGLLNSFVREHFPDNTEWRPLDDLIGMITQMDNACTVARDYLSRAEAAEARVKELEEALEQVEADCRSTIERYERNGPSFTSPNGDHYEPTSFVVDKLSELSNTARTASQRRLQWLG